MDTKTLADMSDPIRYEASLELAVHDHGGDMAEFWSDPDWKLDGEPDREEYAREYAWFAREFDNPDLATGAVLRYYRTIELADAEEFVRDWGGCPGETMAEFADRSARQGLDGPSVMDWNVGGVTYVVDTTLSVYAVTPEDRLLETAGVPEFPEDS